MHKMKKKEYIGCCYLIGEDQLLVECAQILTEKGYSIEGIVSGLTSAKEWADKNRIKQFDTIKEAKSTVMAAQFDYLFSIINPYVIPQELIDKPKKFAINYHDSLLPRYAGVHATSWAILNNEKEHGISWHIITEEVDAGDILKQKKIILEKDETAFSLNLKCYQAGLTAFQELAIELKNNTYIQISQSLEDRSYYGYHQKIPGNGWISWQDSAEHIDRIVRALNLGHYKNRLGLPKLMINDKPFTFNALKILPKQSDYPVGTIIQAFNNQLEITTGTFNVLLSEVKLLDDSARNAEKLDFNDSKDDIKKELFLYSPTPKELQAFTTFSKDYSKDEHFWVKKRLAYKPAILPFVSLNCKKGETLTVWEYSLQDSLFLSLKNHCEENMASEVIFLTCWVIYLSLLGNKNSLGFFILAKQYPVEFESFIETHLPFYINLEKKSSFNAVLKTVSEEYETLHKRGSYFKDIRFRYPVLSDAVWDTQVEVIFDESSVTQAALQKITKSSKAVFFLFITKNSIRLEVKKEALALDNYLADFSENIPGHFNKLLKALIHNQNISISEIEIISDHEKQKVLKEWNNTQAPLPPDSVYELFKKQVDKTPDNIAIYHEEITLTYSALDKKINELAFYIHSLGIRKPSVVGIYADSSPTCIAAFLAMLKLGITYVPLDPFYAKCNIQYILEDCSVEIFITDNKNKADLEQFFLESKFAANAMNFIKIINAEYFKIEKNIDANKINEKDEINKKDEINVFAKLSLASPRDPAYILYTSGTTGRPKGVVIKNESIVNLALSQIKLLTLNESSRILQFSSITFDASVSEIYTAVFTGACLYIPLKGKFLLGRYLEDYVVKHKISIMALPPSILNTLSPEANYSLKALVIGGEACPYSLAKKWFNQCEFINGYGPTETTVYATRACITENQKLHMSIGAPLDNTCLYVLNESLQLLPVGVVGELYIGGKGVALGYQGQIGLTGQKFIPNPFNEKHDKDEKNENYASVLYKTGDLVRWLPNGTLEYFGRKDNQVKIRGFRIELEAIRFALLKHENISECAVSVFEDDVGLKQLVAYVVFKNNSKEKNRNTDLVKTFLKNRLPSYMIPLFFMYMDELPLTSNGKIDYKRLPMPDVQERFIREDYLEPKTKFERESVKIWSKLLKMKKIGIRDNFFDLGGDSLFLTEMILKFEQKLHFSFSLHSFLNLPTIENLSNQYNTINHGFDKNSILNNQYDFINDSRLELNLNPNKIMELKKSTELNYILLTGATGFLGAHLLSDLCHLTQATIICLIRDNSEKEAVLRLKKIIDEYQLNIDESRIIVLVGDLEKPLLGLTEFKFTNLAEKIDVIYHCGAYVHHLYGYEKLKAANVLGTVELLKLATLIKLKDFHYISTLSAVDGFVNTRGAIREEFVDSDDFSACPIVLNGYNQTKWVCERLLCRAHLSGVPVKIYRPGWIMGQSETGICRLNDQHLLMLIKGCAQLGYAPDWGFKLNMTPVDIMSKMIIEISLSSKIIYNVFNIDSSSNITWSELIEWMNLNGFSVKLITSQAWKENYLGGISSNNALFSLLSFYLDKDNGYFEKNSGKTEFHFLDVENNQIKKALETLNRSFFKVDARLLNIYFEFFIKSGFFNDIPMNHTYGKEKELIYV